MPSDSLRTSPQPPEPDLPAIYRTQPDRYDAMVAREDWQGCLLPALLRLVMLDDASVVELGAGTGRLTRLMARHARHVRAFDACQPMLEVAARRIAEEGLGNCSLALADHAALPVAGAEADLAIAGWSISAILLDGSPWLPRVQAALAEMRRVIRPGGTVVVIETLGTGCTEPRPPELLVPYYRCLESSGFRMTWIRTDYRFADRKEARRLTEFFFGPSPLASLVTDPAGAVLPECTGLWWWVSEVPG